MNKLAISLVAAISLTSLSAFAETFSVSPGDDDYDAIQTALLEAQDGDVVELAAGTYVLMDGLSLDTAGVTVRGAGADETILSFKGQATGAEGLIVTSDRVTLEDFAVEDTKGDAIKAKGADQITFRGLRVEWTNGPDEANGAYGLYPVETTNVLIENCVAIGASDAGIYVGQSQDIIVRHSKAMYNVAGIEIENSFRADVYENVATKNTGGILVFDLPNLPQQGGHQVRVFNNEVFDNDTQNFAPEGNIVGTVPTGTGIMIMANTDVEIFNNTITNHGTVGIVVARYPNSFDDDQYQPVPRRVHVHDNVIVHSGFAPEGEIGMLLADILGTPIPDIVWDGAVTIGHRLFGIPEEYRHSFHSNGDATFANADAMLSMFVPIFASIERDPAPYAEPLPALPAASVKQDQ